LDRTREDVVQRLATHICGFQPGPITNRNTQEAKPPALGLTTEAMLISLREKRNNCRSEDLTPNVLVVARAYPQYSPMPPKPPFVLAQRTRVALQTRSIKVPVP